MELSTKDYIEFIKLATLKIDENGDYITSLDAITGDGDHYTNMHMGFSRLVEIEDELSSLSLADCFRKIGMTLMSSIGGSSGALYGSAYIAASKLLVDKDSISEILLFEILQAMLEAIKKRGGAEEGMKTMIDSLSPSVDAYGKGLSTGLSGVPLYDSVKQAAIDGALLTKDMEAIKGRAYYQSNKGVGHLDPGAMTMAYQIETLMDYISTK